MSIFVRSIVLTNSMSKPRYEYEVSYIKRDTMGKRHESGLYPIRGMGGFRFTSERGDYGNAIINTVKGTMRAITGVKIIGD